MPTVQTPILNFLHFLTKDFKDVEASFEKMRNEYESKYGESVLGAGRIDNATVNTEILKNNIAKKLESLAQGVDESNIDDYETVQQVPHMESYIYQNMDAGTFGKLKKLKALSLSENEQEAHAAWVKCMEICNKYKLRYDDIPCKYD